MCWVGGVACDSEGFAGQACIVNVLEGREGGSNDLLRRSHRAPQDLPAGRRAAPVPHGDAAGQDALDGAPVERAHDGG